MARAQTCVPPPNSEQLKEILKKKVQYFVIYFIPFLFIYLLLLLFSKSFCWALEMSSQAFSRFFIFPFLLFIFLIFDSLYFYRLPLSFSQNFSLLCLLRPVRPVASVSRRNFSPKPTRSLKTAPTHRENAIFQLRNRCSPVQASPRGERLCLL
jgi:hypothetical protein